MSDADDDRLKGWETYTTEDGVRVALLHYSADQSKDPENENGGRWLRRQLRGYPGGMEGAKWQQEMEVNFRVRAGDRVFSNWDTRVERAISYEPGSIDIADHWPVYGGLDWGTANKTVWTAHAFEGTERGYLFDEETFQGDEVTVNGVAQTIMRKPYFERVRGVFGDPSIWAKEQVGHASRTSIGELLANEGLVVEKGRNERGVDMAFVALLKGYLWADLKDPKWMISRDCRQTLKSFRNLRKKPNHGMTDYKDNPEEIIQKNVDEFDSCKYVLLSLGFEAPEIEEIIPDSFDWWLKQTVEEKRRFSNVLW